MGTLNWDTKVGPYGETIIIGETFEDFTNMLNPESTTESYHNYVRPELLNTSFSITD